jgi:rubredoxin
VSGASFFAGAYGGDVSTLADESRLECRICWWVYDPAEGDPTRQIPSGTPFSQLPQDWSCPNCSGDRGGFLLLEG